MRRLAKNLLAVLSGDILRRLFGFLALAVLARRVGADGFGMVSLALTVFSYGVMVSSAGLHLLGIREVASGRASQFAGEMIGARLVLSLCCWLLIAAGMIFVHNHLQAVLILVVTISLLPNALFLDWYFQGKEEMGKPAMARLLSAAVYLLVIVLFVRSTAGLLWVGIAAVAGDMAAAALYARFFRMEGERYIVRFDPKRWLGHLRQSVPLGAGSMFGQLSVNFPILAIGVLMAASDVGVFSAASKLVFFLLMLDRVIATLLIPASVRLFAESADRLSRELQKAIKWVLLLGLPTALGGTLLAARVIPLVYGAKFSGAVPLFRIYIWYFVATLLHTVYTAGIIAVRREKQYGRIMAYSAGMYIVGVLAGIYIAGLAGAAAAVVIAETITMLMMRDALNTYLFVSVPREWFRILLACGVLAALLWYWASLPALLLIVLAGTIYLALLFLMRVLRFQEISEMLRVTP